MNKQKDKLHDKVESQIESRIHHIETANANDGTKQVKEEAGTQQRSHGIGHWLSCLFAPLRRLFSVSMLLLFFSSSPASAQGMIDPQQMQAPQLTQPRVAQEVEDAIALNFAYPVQFSWLPCTNPSAQPVQVTYSLRFWRLMGLHPHDCITEMEPTWEVKNLRSPQFLYNQPVTERVAYFPEGEVIAMVVVADVKSMNGQPVNVANNGVSPYTLFRVVHDPTAPAPKVKAKKKKNKSKEDSDTE